MQASQEREALFRKEMTEHAKEAFEKYYAKFNPKSISGDDCWCDVSADKLFIAGYNAAAEKLYAEIADLKEQLEIHKQHAKLDFLQIKSLNSKIELLENKPKRRDPHDDGHLYGGNVC